jgi:3-hydroxyacyl-CoA dehydrogenase/enoyl-CoA hydratase/3-hydroxybutyryl-CoA epimerase
VGGVIDLVGIPQPNDAPEPGACVRIDRPKGPDGKDLGLCRIHLDPPHRKMPVFDVPLLRDLDQALDEIALDDSVKCLVIAGRDPLTFAAGADIETISKIDDPHVARRFCREGQKLFQNLYRMGRRGGGKLRTVAAVGGAVPGGACEIGLACDLIVIADHQKTRIGLPEVLLGILPAWGGSQRLPRRLGIVNALGAILAGKLYPARKALKLGLVDRMTKPEYLWEIADKIALGQQECRHRGRSGLGSRLTDKNPLFAAFVANQAQKGVMKKTGGRYPAALSVIPLVVRAPRVPIDKGLEAETEAIMPLTTSKVSESLVGLFLLKEESKKLAALPSGEKAARTARAAIIGAGVMGRGIASQMAERGIDVRLRDLDRSQLDAAEHFHRGEINKKLRRRRMGKHEAAQAIDRLEVTTNAGGFARCEIAIEAVAEKIQVKRAVLGELAEIMGPDAILASNTSSLSIDEIALELPHPERVIGMHFFNPPRKMPLVEIVRGEKTSDEVLARTARLALDLGKTPVVTKDCAGFLVNRVLGPYLDEAVRLMERGVNPILIDRALKRFGMPMGPCELIDEVGLDIAAHAGASLEAAYGERMKACRYLAPLLEAGQMGKKSGAGIFTWSGKKKSLKKNRKLPKPKGRFSMSEEAIIDRLVLAMVNEAARALQEEVVSGPRQLDLATVFGMGFAPFHGGVLRYADTRGHEDIVRHLEAVREEIERFEGVDGERIGRFTPVESLLQSSKSGILFHHAAA